MTTAFHKKRLNVLQQQKRVELQQQKRVEFKAKLEEPKKTEEKKPVELKPILTIKIDAPQVPEKKSEEHHSTSSAKAALGVVMMSKKKSKDWLHVPVRQKPKAPLFPEKIEEEIVEEEEISDDPVVIKGAKVNLLGNIMTPKIKDYFLN